MRKNVTLPHASTYCLFDDECWTSDQVAIPEFKTILLAEIAVQAISKFAVVAEYVSASFESSSLKARRMS